MRELDSKGRCVYCANAGFYRDDLTGGESYCLCEHGVRLKQMEAVKQAGVMLLIRNGLVLGITRRHNRSIYGLPGGKFDPQAGDKNSADTAVRETLEETGIVVKSCIQVYQRIERGDGPDGVDFYSTCYYATEWEGEPTSSEEGDVKWLTVEEITSSKAAFGEYNSRTIEVFRKMFPEVSLGE